MPKLKTADVYQRLSDRVGISRKETERIIEALLKLITEEMQKGAEVVFTGFGSFLAKSRKGRRGVDPKTRSPMEIPTVVVPKFKAGKNLKEALKTPPEEAGSNPHHENAQQYFVHRAH